MTNKVWKVQIVEHFHVDDKDCGGEYYEVDVLVDDEKVITYGDYYHDKGQDKAEGFVDGVKYYFGEKNVDVVPRKLVADWDY